MPKPTPATYGLLGLLSARSWTGYELTRQVQRSLRFVWPVSEGHLYREQRYLAERGWVTVAVEQAGRRTRNRYEITEAGREALAEWMRTVPEEPHLQIEGVLRAFHADKGTPADLQSAMVRTAEQARAMSADLAGFAAEYLSPDGPLSMLESGTGGPEGERLRFAGRPMFPERLHAVALALDITTELLGVIDELFSDAAREVAGWPSTTDPSLTPATRSRLERTAARG